MNILQQVVLKIKGNECEKLVKRSGTEIELSGASIVEGGLNINIGNFSNKIKELVNVSDIAVALDDSQYHLCIAIFSVKDNEQLKNRYIAIRLQLIIAFNQLRAILSSIKEEPSEDLKKQLAKWLRYMNDLHKHSISLLDPESDISSKSGVTLGEIRKYQGINESELKDAIDHIKNTQ